jgi:hypothetical protein
MKQVLTFIFGHAWCIDDKAVPDTLYVAVAMIIVSVGIVLMMMTSNLPFDIIHSIIIIIIIIIIIANEQNTIPNVIIIVFGCSFVSVLLYGLLLLLLL